MPEEENRKRYDLEDRTEDFARRVRSWARVMRPDPLQWDDVRQAIRASGSIAANYIEANEALSKRDFLNRIKISRKESKESRLWLRLLVTTLEQAASEDERAALEQEATELMNIFGAILRRSE